MLYPIEFLKYLGRVYAIFIAYGHLKFSNFFSFVFIVIDKKLYAWSMDQMLGNDSANDSALVVSCYSSLIILKISRNNFFYNRLKFKFIHLSFHFL